MRSELRFGLLGAPAVYDADGEPQPVQSAKGRALLAALLLEPGRVVSVDALKDALWGGHPPASAHASLQNHVTRLRRLLDDPDRLRAVPPGYRLRVGEGELDVRVFEQLVSRARAAHAEHDWEACADAAADALALWRGTPLDGLPPDAAGHALVPRLEEARLLALELRYDAEIGLGSGGGLVPELAELVAEYPLREAFHRQLMLVLHRAGRQAEALAVHRELRRRLVEELGVEPGAAVREAHRVVLQEPGGSAVPGVADSEPAVIDDPVAAAASAAAPAPAQLPPSPPHFTGRTDVTYALSRLLAGGGDEEGTSPVAVVSGMAGVGKSALALHVAHGLRERFPDGQLYVNLHGATPGMTPLTPDQALAALLRDLGVEPQRSPQHPDAASALLRSLLAPTRTLMVLDDAATAAQVRPLLPAGSGCAVIVTSRSPLAALDGAGRFPLEPLSGRDSAALLRAVSGRAGLEAGHPLVELAGRLPLALRIVAARLAARRALTPDALAELLTASDGRLHHLEHDDLSVRRSLAVALDALCGSEREADQDAAVALARIGALDLPTYGVPLLARLLGVAERRAEAALDRLVDVALLDETAYGRYAPHDLVRDFAREAARQSGCGVTGAEVAESALHWYAESALQSLLAIMPEGLDRDDRMRGVAERLSAPGDRSEGRAAAGAVPAMSTDQAYAWGDTELANVIAVADRYGRSSALLPVLVRCSFSYLKRRGRLAEADLLTRLAVTAARRSGDRDGEAQALTDLAGLSYVSGRSGAALDLIDEALVLWRELDHVSCVHRAVINRGLLLEALGRYEEAADALRQSMELAKSLDDPLSEAFALSNLGNIYEHTDARAAIDCHRRSLEIGEAQGHDGVRQEAHCDIGYSYLALGEPAAALKHFEESLRIHDEAEDWHNESRVRLGTVRALRELSRTCDAVRECDDLLDRAEARADDHRAGLARHQRGLLLYADGHVEEAYAQWEAALAALDGTDSSEVVGELKGLLAGSVPQQA
ncbi:tetratricopeptide repeat protein [Streptomyces sp. NBC_01381]|uniref:AfsR/SARP family transcriptional regulator n=1 Tax=Streptomyces sp. NBC_01381 TaxID=2903845 RepID=UPI00224EE412|nr:BTAD domain-containing putative transcriptional regulator [Streptomyces sp. NBC_01381]MCX4665445.1 tetratricopeptide repeat protein [Streptomyces sp. NBC_01381]